MESLETVGKRLDKGWRKCLAEVGAASLSTTSPRVFVIVRSLLGAAIQASAGCVVWCLWCVCVSSSTSNILAVPLVVALVVLVALVALVLVVLEVLVAKY